MYTNLGIFSLVVLSGSVTFAAGLHNDNQHVVGTGIVVAVFGGVFLLVYGLFYWSLRKRLDFVSSMLGAHLRCSSRCNDAHTLSLGTASACIAQNRGIIYVSLATLAGSLVVQGVDCILLSAFFVLAFLLLCDHPYITTQSFTPIDITAPLVGLIAAAAMRHDDYRPNPEALHVDGRTCTNALHSTVACCVPEATGLPMAVVLAGLPLVSWTSFIVWGVRIFCIGGVVHAWYYAPTGRVGRVRWC
jgi:hypothetical protein